MFFFKKPKEPTALEIAQEQLKETEVKLLAERAELERAAHSVRMLEERAERLRAMMRTDVLVDVAAVPRSLRKGAV